MKRTLAKVDTRGSPKRKFMGVIRVKERKNCTTKRLKSKIVWILLK
jgi:hypothetical protein